jgi:anti-anti-sigma factor
MGLQISIRASGDVTILDLQGKAMAGADCDLLNGHLQMLIASGVRELLVNLTDVSQLDSSAISAISKAYVLLRDQGGNLKLLHPSGRVRSVLQVIHLLDLIPTFEDEAQALASFPPLPVRTS